MNIIRFPSILPVRVGGKKCFAYGGKPYVDMDYLIKSMTPKERAQFPQLDDVAPFEAELKQG
jgi:hypothetical protein